MCTSTSLKGQLQLVHNEMSIFVNLLLICGKRGSLNILGHADVKQKDSESLSKQERVGVKVLKA